MGFVSTSLTFYSFGSKVKIRFVLYFFEIIVAPVNAKNP